MKKMFYFLLMTATAATMMMGTRSQAFYASIKSPKFKRRTKSPESLMNG
jgi:hypothetical protein